MSAQLGNIGMEFSRKLNPWFPRVGKRVLENENILSQIQKGAPQLKIQRVEACRGTERLRVPSPDIDPALVPMRLTVIKDRASGKALVLGPAEEWSTLPKRQQIRKGKPARVSLTIFGHRKSETDDVGAPDGVVSDEEQKGGLDVGILGHAPPRMYLCMARGSETCPKMNRLRFDGFTTIWDIRVP